MNADHVVLGTGAIAAELVERGEEVLMVNRSGRADADGVEIVGGDAADPAITTAVTAGASCARSSGRAGSRW